MKLDYCPFCSGSVKNVGEDDDPLFRCICCDIYFTVHIQDRKWMDVIKRIGLVKKDTEILEQLELGIKGA